MPNEKACVVFTNGLEKEMRSVSDELSDNGFNICVAAADEEMVKAAQAGAIELTDSVKNCIANAKICVFLIPKNQAECIVMAAQYAGSSGKTMIAIAEDANFLPSIFDDLAKAVLIIGSKNLSNALQGESIWEIPNSSPDGKRQISRVKCQ